MNLGAAGAFKTVVNEIGAEIFTAWRSNPNLFAIHPNGAAVPTSQRDFRKMFQAEINDANTASVISGALGIPIMALHAGSKILAGKNIMVNQSQLDRQKPNISDFVRTII